MDFRAADGRLDLGELSEVWIDYDFVPIVGVVMKDGDPCYFSAYGDAADGSPLYLFSFVDEDVIQDMKNGRIDALTGFSHHSALIFKEIEVDGKIEAHEISYFEIPESDLPEEGAYL